MALGQACAALKVWGRIRPRVGKLAPGVCLWALFFGIINFALCSLDNLFLGFFLPRQPFDETNTSS